MKHSDVVIVGAGVVGLAFAWEAAKRGKSVTVLERSRFAEGASVRNFGMVWPVGQSSAKLVQTALRSRESWLTLQREAGIWLDLCGSLHVVYEDDENQVLQEFIPVSAGLGMSCEYLTPAETLKRFPSVNPDGLRGALFSSTECAVNPPRAIRATAKWLAAKYGITFQFETAVTKIDDCEVLTATGERFRAAQIFVCSGADFETLFPQQFYAAGLTRCKLQMMRTGPQPSGWRIGTHLAGGLTLGHYQSFAPCPTLAAVKKRIAATMPDYVRYGIHVMASQTDTGEVIIGDSHEYDADIDLFDKSEIDEWILQYLRKMLRLPDWTIRARWHGIYAKHPKLPHVNQEVQPGCRIVTSPGGAGMTLSFGLAGEWWDAHEQNPTGSA